ncbi:hypothetical protein FRC12_012738 [Ceratobasidium sp. 428]|nr:hypothetical protein FRC12_012738 [Ceratobasidium sp. 428]
MASLVAQKPSDNPTSPGQMMSLGTDPAALEDYLNLDLFGAAPASASRASQSPASSHGALPVTPGTAEQSSSAGSLFPALDASPNAGLQFLDSYTPLDKNFGAFPDLGMLPGSSMDLGISPSLDYNNLFHDMFSGFSDPGPSNAADGLFGTPPAVPQAAPAAAPIPSSAIDPQLFTAPTPAPAPVLTPAPLSAPRAMTVDSDDDNSDEDDLAHEEDDEVAPLPITSPTRSGAGRRPRKNAAAAGGISKRPSRASTPSSVVPSYVHFDDPKPVIPPALGKGGVASYLNGERIGSQEPDEWRPTPEEYKKLSSKEKRQLRNKISARNFRVRRKEYITTLESHIADRDQLISAIRSELSVTHNENNELRREIDALKRAIQEGRLSAEATGLPPPRPLTPEGTPAATPTTATRRKDLPRANTQKDRGNDPSKSFWGGAINGGVTSVHATLIPEFPAAQVLSEKRTPSASPPSSTGPATPPSDGVNMNPLMNLSPLFGSSKLPASSAVNVGLDIMGDAFNQRTLDGFRAQLWGRMAKEAGARSVERERQAMEGVESEVGPVDSAMSESPSGSSAASGSSASPSVASGSRSSSGSPQLHPPTPPHSDSSSTPPQQTTVSSSPSLSMLHSPAGIRSLFDTAATIQPALAQPSLFQASIFGAGFGTGKPAQNTFTQQNASSAQARAMLQAQWLALQQSRQLSASSPNVLASASSSNVLGSASSPNVLTEAQNQAQASTYKLSTHQGPSTAGQRETYLAQFAQAVAAQQQAQQAQQQAQLGGLAKDVRPAFFASADGKKAGASASGVEKGKTGGIVDKLKLSTSTSLTSTSSTIVPVTSAASATTDKKGATPQQAALFATLASQTLLQRMGSAFWDAFSSKPGSVDTDKVRKVLEGTAVVRVVDVEKESGLDGLEERMKKMSVGGGGVGVGNGMSGASGTGCVGCAAGGLGVFSDLRGKK